MNAQQTRSPNILLIIADDHRADAIGAMGNPAVQAPHLDRLAREGTSFTNTFTGIPLCAPARAQLLTGRPPFRTGVVRMSDPIAPGLKLLPQALSEAGYRTFYTGKWHNDGTPDQRCFDQTRRVFEGGMGPHEMTFTEDGGEATGFSSELFADAAEEFVRRPHDRPWFAQLAFTAPHDPRTPPGSYATMYDPDLVPLPDNFMPEHPFDNGMMNIRDELLETWPRKPGDIRRHLAEYYGMISHMDEQIGRVLRALDESGQTESTIVVYLSDHGLAVGSHGLMGKQNMYDHSVRVPLILRGPGIPVDRCTHALCQSYDLYPTLCGLVGAPVPESVEGVSLAPLLDGESATNREFVCSAFDDMQRMIRTDRWKLVYYPKIRRYQLFDLLNDPEELVDLLVPWRLHPSSWGPAIESPEQYPPVAAELREKLQDWQSEVGDPLSGTLARIPS